MAVDAYIDSAFAITKVSKKYEVRSMQQHTEYIFTGASLILMDNAVSNLKAGDTAHVTHHNTKCCCVSPQALVEAFIQDNTSHSLPNHLRQSVLREYLHKAQQG